MMYLEVDLALEDWARQAYFRPASRSSGRNILSGRMPQRSRATARPGGLTLQQKLQRTVHKTPEVMVKVSGGGKNMPHIQAHLTYISRHGQISLEDEQGYMHQEAEGLHDVRTLWSQGGMGIPKQSDKRKEAFNIVLSMPPGTDRQAVHEAARAFAQAQFQDHQYVFAAHNDEKHPHVHLCVKATSCRRIRLNPRKNDLQAWREHFAEKLEDYGIEANTTPRRARGVVPKAERQVLRHINEKMQRGWRIKPC